MRKTVFVFLALLAMPGMLNAQPATVSPQGLSFTLDPSRTEPGTLEVEIGTWSGNSFDLPWIVKFTGDTGNLILHDVEWAVAGGIRGNGATLMIRRPIYRGKNFAIGISPRVAFSFEGDTTPVPGLAVLISFTRGLNGFAVNGEVNRFPGVTRKAIYADYSRSLGTNGLCSKFSLFAGVMLERAGENVVSMGQGMTYRIRPNVDVQMAIRQMDITGDRQVVLLTDLVVNLGRVQR